MSTHTSQFPSPSSPQQFGTISALLLTPHQSVCHSHTHFISLSFVHKAPGNLVMNWWRQLSNLIKCKKAGKHFWKMLTLDLNPSGLLAGTNQNIHNALFIMSLCVSLPSASILSSSLAPSVYQHWSTHNQKPIKDLSNSKFGQSKNSPPKNKKKQKSWLPLMFPRSVTVNSRSLQIA